MKGLLIFVALFSSSAYAKPFFQDCKAALAQPHFHLLAQNQESLKQIIAVNDSPNLGQCFHLNDHEFLIIPETTQATSGSLYYCNFNHGRGCKPYQYREQLPSVAVAKEFDGGRKKHFALLSTDFLEHGYSGHDYFVLYLSKHKKSQPFTFQHLVGVNGVRGGLCGEEDDKPMGGWEPDVTSDFSDKMAYQIKYTGKNSVMLVFNLVKKNCKSGQKVKYQERFVFRQDRFVKISRVR
ncbi:MAG: hypothetical protein KGO49_12205 [Gammaproteobacteria bacterium]|nr:hypothetical protein [Gammaproteobacteria bacterium]